MAAASSSSEDLKAKAQQLHQTVFADTASDAESVKQKEEAIGQLSDTYVKLQDAKALTQLLSQLRPFFAVIPKAKTAKIVRNIIDQVAKIPNSTDIQVAVCKEQVDWAIAEKRTFLRQRIQLRLASLYLATAEYTESLKIVGTLLTEVKKLDDKLLLVDIHLLESRVHHALRNQPKSRASLTAARTAANAIYVPISLQAEIDTQSGILHADERDFKTAYSYFFEAFEQFSALDDRQAVAVLKYMLLCKVMLSEAGDVPAIISSKAGLKYVGRDVDAMRVVAKAYQDRSLKEFQGVLDSYKEQLVGDAIIHTHLTALYGTLLEQNLVRLIEPFSRVEISHIASLIDLPLATVEQKLSQMILDKKFAGTLDQGAGCLEVFAEPPAAGMYGDALDIMDTLGSVVDTLWARSQNVVAAV
uniref:PCI domain-containing protein n=1 Tax=Tetradesmus obliquus TaxID=3088 RepID=A0A383WIP6_TETOB|eukprot:jgi/Sobl393_1/13193/SZX68770.1